MSRTACFMVVALILAILTVTSAGNGKPGDNPGKPGDNPGTPGNNPGNPGDVGSLRSAWNRDHFSHIEEFFSLERQLNDTLDSLDYVQTKTDEICNQVDVLKTETGNIDAALATRGDIISDKLDGIQVILDSLQLVCPQDPIVLVGSPTSAVDDAQSFAGPCPVGFVMMSCRCSSIDADCDGVEITSDKRCYARNGANPSPGGIQAIAICIPGDATKFQVIRDPSGTGRDHNPEATCPTGYTVIACFLHHL